VNTTVIVGPRTASNNTAGSNPGVTSLRQKNARDTLTGDVLVEAGQHLSIEQDSARRILKFSVADLPATIVSALNGLDGNVTLVGQGVVITKDAQTRRLTIAFDPSGVVTALNGLHGGLSLVAGENVAIDNLGNGQLQISASGTGGGSGGSYGYGVADRATFYAGFGLPILVGADYGARHIVLRPSRPGALYAHLTSPQVAGDFIFDLLRSIDGGVTWTSILLEAITIPAGFSGIVASSQFPSGAQLAPGNLLRLDILSSGRGPGFASGFICSLRLDGDTVPGWDRATILFGLSEQPLPAVDYGIRWIATRRTRPAMLYAFARQPPIGSSTLVDLQVLRDGAWISLFPPGQPLSFAPGVTSVLASDSFAEIQLLPGDLVRPIILDCPVSSGLGFNIALELEVTS